MRLDNLTTEVFSDIAGKPYVLICGFPKTSDDETSSAGAMEIKFWANYVHIEDNRRNA